MSKHTPGPWAVRHSVDVYSVSGRIIVAGDGAPPINETDEANACLIAAAPELLRLLRRLADGIDLGGGEIGPELSLGALEAYRAIAKAEGRDE